MRHLAIIMDGNGRWATQKGLSRLEGHAEGYRTLRKVVDWCSQLKIEFLTVYGFSSENWRRSDEEVGGLMELIERAMLEQILNLKEHNVRVRVAGRLYELPASLRSALQRGIDETSECTGLNFTLAINYGGRAEIVDAFNRLARTHSGSPIEESDVSANLYLPELPETDLMIRTAGEQRWSNFLLWQSAYAEMYVTDTLWPDFSKEDLERALADFSQRVRKFGAVV